MEGNQLDHNAGTGCNKIIPTVIFQPDLDMINVPTESFFQGDLFVECKDGVQQPSTAARAATELSMLVDEIIRDGDREEFKKSLAFFSSDGIPSTIKEILPCKKLQ